MLTLVLSSLFLTSCKKKSDPSPAASTTDPYGSTNVLIYNGVSTPLSTSHATSGNTYSITGTATTGSAQYIIALFNGGQPQKSSTEDLSKSTVIQLMYTSANMQLTATSGTANIVVGDTSITVYFTNATFTNTLGASLQFSGQIIVSTKIPTGTTGGTTPTTTTSGSLTLNGTTSALTVQTLSAYGVYNISGTTSTYNTISATLYSGKPTASSTYNLATSSNISLSYTDVSTYITYTATSGTATVSVVGTAITISFTNAVFTAQNPTSTIQLSASLYTSN
jgi:hypothetical protein